MELSMVVAAVWVVSRGLIVLLLARFILVTIANHVGWDCLGQFWGTIHDWVGGATEFLVAYLRRIWPEAGLAVDWLSLLAIVPVLFVTFLITNVLAWFLP